MIRKVLWLYLPNSLFWINDLRSAKGEQFSVKAPIQCRRKDNHSCGSNSQVPIWVELTLWVTRLETRLLLGFLVFLSSASSPSASSPSAFSSLDSSTAGVSWFSSVESNSKAFPEPLQVLYSRLLMLPPPRSTNRSR